MQPQAIGLTSPYLITRPTETKDPRTKQVNSQKIHYL
jgi:hypothetical protein